MTGGPVLFRFEYVTDPAVDPPGFFADDITLTADGGTVFVDGAEAGTADWELDGFKASTGTEAGSLRQLLHRREPDLRVVRPVAEDRPVQLRVPEHEAELGREVLVPAGRARSPTSTPRRSDNNTSEHPGEGLALQIDAHPEPIIGPDGDPWRPRIQLYDATFGHRVAGVVHAALAVHGQAPGVITGLPAQPVFDDTKQWWFASQPNAGVKTRKAGVRINVLDERTYSVVVRLTPTAADLPDHVQPRPSVRYGRG